MWLKKNWIINKKKEMLTKKLVSEKKWGNSQTPFTCNLLENVDDK